VAAKSKAAAKIQTSRKNAQEAQETKNAKKLPATLPLLHLLCPLRLFAAIPFRHAGLATTGGGRLPPLSSFTLHPSLFTLHSSPFAFLHPRASNKSCHRAASS
jgi:hypothetical protein